MAHACIVLRYVSQQHQHVAVPQLGCYCINDQVWTTQVMQFVASPEDGPGALRLDYQVRFMSQS